ncbi:MULTISPECIES: hypothetical protein [Nostoc]|nr:MULTISPECIES: hypothetical protein [Nostoc]
MKSNVNFLKLKLKLAGDRYGFSQQKLLNMKAVVLSNFLVISGD